MPILLISVEYFFGKKDELYLYRMVLICTLLISVTSLFG